MPFYRRPPRRDFYRRLPLSPDLWAVPSTGKPPTFPPEVQERIRNRVRRLDRLLHGKGSVADAQIKASPTPGFFKLGKDHRKVCVPWFGPTLWTVYEAAQVFLDINPRDPRITALDETWQGESGDLAPKTFQKYQGYLLWGRPAVVRKRLRQSHWPTPALLELHADGTLTARPKGEALLTRMEHAVLENAEPIADVLRAVQAYNRAVHAARDQWASKQLGRGKPHKHRRKSRGRIASYTPQRQTFP